MGVKNKVTEALNELPISYISEKIGASKLSIIRLRKGLPASVDAYLFLDFIESVLEKEKL